MSRNRRTPALEFDLKACHSRKTHRRDTAGANACHLRFASPARSDARLATSSPCRCAGDIIARFIAAAMNPHGGVRPVSIRSSPLARFGLRPIHCRQVRSKQRSRPPSSTPIKIVPGVLGTSAKGARIKKTAVLMRTSSSDYPCATERLGGRPSCDVAIFDRQPLPARPVARPAQLGSLPQFSQIGVGRSRIYWDFDRIAKNIATRYH